ncbi:MAG: hypothetical protein ACHQIK_18130 [Candidatus Acidiferrales bacterium]
MSDSFVLSIFDLTHNPFGKVFRERRIRQNFRAAHLLNLLKQRSSAAVHKRHATHVKSDLFRA